MARAEITDPAVVLEAAARFLEARPRSVQETRRRLVSAGYRADLVEATIEGLVELGMLDDEAFARMWLESRDRAHPRGRRALRQELRLKGIDDDIALQALDQRDLGREGSAEETTEEQVAQRLLDRKRRLLDRLDDPRLRRSRAYELLTRAGFASDLASRLAASLNTPPDDDADLGT